MEQTNETETEQLYEKMTGKADDKPEQVEENETEEKPEQETEETTEQEQDEPILSEEELEIEREIAEYASKIEQLDAKLSEYKANSINDSKREAMRKMNYSEVQIERYLSHVEGETADEIKESVSKLSLEIPPKDNYGDPSAMNGERVKPKPVDHTEIGKKAFGRIKHKIFPWMR